MNVVARGQLQESFNARAGVFRTLPFKTVRQQHHHTGKQSPFFFACTDELIDDRLGNIGKIAKLRFPQNQRVGIITTVAILIAKDARFREG